MITVRNLMAKLEDIQIKLVSGIKGVDKSIEYINIQEFALKSERIQENGVLLTTFTSYLDSPDITDHLKWLQQKKINAIGIHTIFIEEIPRKVIDFSNANDFPIFTIPKEISYQQVMQKYNELLIKETDNTRKKIEQVSINILKGVAFDKGTQYILTTLGRQLNTPVMYINQTSQIEAFWTGNHVTKHKLQSVAKEITEQESFKSETVDYCLGNYSFQLFPIVDRQFYYGTLVIGSTQKLKISDWSIINYGKTALLLESVKIYSIDKHIKNQDMKIIESILTLPKQADEGYEQLSKTLKKQKYLYLFEANHLMHLNNFYEELYTPVNKIDPEALLWIYNDRIICLIDSLIPRKILHELNQKFTQIYCGISNKSVNQSADTIRKKYKQAEISLHTGKIRNKRINYWDSIGLDKVLISLAETSFLKDSFHELLTPLINHDEQFGSELIQTLEVYLSNFFSLKESAEILTVHRNTVKYRLDKIKELYEGIDFHHIECYLLFQMALKTYNLNS